MMRFFNGCEYLYCNGAYAAFFVQDREQVDIDIELDT